MSEMNSEVSEIVLGSKLIKPQPLVTSIESTSDRIFLFQKVSGLFNTIYIRQCRISNYTLFVSSKKKAEEQRIDIMQYNYKLELKSEYDKALKEAKDK